MADLLSTPWTRLTPAPRTPCGWPALAAVVVRATTAPGTALRCPWDGVALAPALPAVRALPSLGPSLPAMRAGEAPASVRT